MNLFRKKPKSAAPDMSGKRPAVRKSVCTGEMTGGYIDRETGKFHELELIPPGGLDGFCKSLNVSPDDVETIY